ncbi:MAG: SGNH/GDSL hydrolase family protein [Bacteroidota bacterium]|nr:SGNH/GDSL hydrolase family protein [Bacteroidota bacterium]
MNQDWPNLQKYQEANAAISEPPVAVFMGNSITEGWVKMHPQFFSENKYVGRGISGQTTPQMLIRFQQDVIDLQPEVVVILAGTNDIAGNTGYSSEKMITDNIRSMVVLAQANDIKVVLSSILPVYDYRWRPGLEPVAKIKSINSWLKEYASKNGLVYLDYFSKMKDDRDGLPIEYSEDGVHPTSAGYDVMQPMAQKAIQEALENQ